MSDEATTTATTTAAPPLGTVAETSTSTTTIAAPVAAPSATGAATPPAPETAKPDPRLTELEEKLANQTKAIEAQRADALAMLADRLGVLPQYRQFVPSVDPFSADGKAALQKWAQEHPEICKPAAPVAPVRSDEFEAKLAKMAANPLVNVAAWRAARAAMQGEVR